MITWSHGILLQAKESTNVNQVSIFKDSLSITQEDIKPHSSTSNMMVLMLIWMIFWNHGN